MKWNEIKEKIIFGVVMTIIVIVTSILTHISIRSCVNSRVPSPPVERDVIESTIDSIIVENDKIIIEINNLDSIKDAKVIEIKSLDNDSTLKLFYQLISR